MTRGVTETTRGATLYPKEQSVVVRRNASAQDLAQAQAYVGKHVNPTPQPSQQTSAPSYRCTGVRLDDLKRLIFDLERDEHPGGNGARDAAII